MSAAILEVFWTPVVRCDSTVPSSPSWPTTAGSTECSLADGEVITAADVVSNASLPVTWHARRPGCAGPDRGRTSPAAASESRRSSSTWGSTPPPPRDRLLPPARPSSTKTPTTTARLRPWRTLEPARALCVSCYDVAPIGFSPPGASHVSLVTLQYADVWGQGGPTGHARTKYAYAQTLLDLCERVTPGVRDAIEEIGGHTADRDAIPGPPWRSDLRLRPGRHRGLAVPRPRQPHHVPGPHVAGSRVGMGGFQPTLESGPAPPVTSCTAPRSDPERNHP